MDQWVWRRHQEEVLFPLIMQENFQYSMSCQEIMILAVVCVVVLFLKMFLMLLSSKTWVMSFSNRRSLWKLSTAIQGALPSPTPTVVAYTNRAMAYIKLRRFQEAEDDCTKALNLDDCYRKAYSCTATAIKELDKVKESMENAEFALRLEPNNQEVKKQYADAKSLYEKICRP